MRSGRLDAGAPSGIQTSAAFFDMDGTILAANSGWLLARRMWRHGEISTWTLARSLGWLTRYKLALVQMEDLTDALSSHVRGLREADMRVDTDQWYHDELSAHVIPQTVDAIRGHQAEGEQAVMLTAAGPYLAWAVARDLGMDDVISTTLEVDAQGRFTGRLDRPLCYGQGKVELAERWASARGVDLDACAFYTDSYTDLPMLERVGRPAVINPDPRLARWARARGVPTRRYA